MLRLNRLPHTHSNIFDIVQYLNCVIITFDSLLPTRPVDLVCIKLLEGSGVLRLRLTVVILLNRFYRHVLPVLNELVMILEYAIAFVYNLIWSKFFLYIR